MVKKYRKWSFWKPSDRFWRCNIVLSRRPRCTCTKPDTVPRTFWIVITAERRMKTWNNDHQRLLAIYIPHMIDYINIFISMAILTRAWRNVFMKLTSVIITSSATLKSCWLLKSPLLLLYPKLSSLRNDNSINLNLPDHVCFLRKYHDRRLQNKERINVLFMMI